jgi:hypothetical protein
LKEGKKKEEIKGKERRKNVNLFFFLVVPTHAFHFTLNY